MSERFQTFFTRLRPHRAAVLINVNDPMWQGTCISIIEFLSQCWGGYHSMIVPTDGDSIEVVFWKLLSAFDPDLIFYYSRTVADVKRWDPPQAEKIIQDQIDKFRAQGDEDLDELSLRKQMLKMSVDAFTISPDLTRLLLERLSPFHFEDTYRVMRIRNGDSPPHPFTKVIDVIPYVPSPDALHVLNDNLQPPRTAPPALWLHAESGVASLQFQRELTDAGVTPVFQYFNTASDGDIIDWGINPERKLGDRTPFGLTRLGLNVVKSTQARPYSIPNVIVRGDALKDFCLYYDISRNNGRAIWLPQWFIPANTEYPDTLIAAIRKIERIGRDLHCSYFSLISLSVPVPELKQLNALVHQHMPSVNASVDDGNNPGYLDQMLRHPGKVYLKKNTDRITTHQFVGDKLPGYYESPVPLLFSDIKATQHRWIVEIQFLGHPVPRHPDLGRTMATGPNVYDARTSIDGLAYQCPGALVMGDDMELQMLRVEITLPSSDEIFRIALKRGGYECSVSDKGAYALETTRRFGGLERLASLLRYQKTKSLLKKFMDNSKNEQGVHDQGALVGGRRYLDFLPIRDIMEGDDEAMDTVDEWIARQIMHRGFIFKCSKCTNTAWYSVESLTQTFTCPRCNTEQQYMRSNWLHSTQPPWHYKLDEIVYQFLAHHGDVPVVTIDALRKQSPNSFIYSPELKIWPEADPGKKMEIDICCIIDNRMIIGEAKSNDSLKVDGHRATKLTGKYEDLAKRMGASGVVFSTTEPDWDQPSKDAIDHMREHNPLLWIYNYRQRDLNPKK
jgi:hypothetical protein